MNTAEVFEELNSSYNIESISLKYGLGEIKFSRDEFLYLYQIQNHVAEIVNKAFVEKFIMHCDLTKEEVSQTVNSLLGNEKYLSEKGKELREHLPKSANGILQIIEQLRSQCSFFAKQIYSENETVTQGNQGEYPEYKIRTIDWLPNIIRKFRIEVYPLIKALIDILPDDHLAKSRANEVWFMGRTILAENEKDLAAAIWRVHKSTIMTNEGKKSSTKRWWQFWKN